MSSLNLIDDIARKGPFIYTASVAGDLSHLLAEKGFPYFLDVNDLGNCRRIVIADNEEIYIFTVQIDKNNFTNIDTNNIFVAPEESTKKIFGYLGLDLFDFEIHYTYAEYEIMKNKK
jgi:hypothetical protein